MSEEARIEELERDVKKWRERAQADHLENGQIKRVWTEQQKRIEELEAENHGLRRALKHRSPIPTDAEIAEAIKEKFG